MNTREKERERERERWLVSIKNTKYVLKRYRVKEGYVPRYMSSRVHTS